MGYGDAIRVLGTLAVVINHVCDMVLFHAPAWQAQSAGWWMANVVDAACRWAVPAYIMLSGALLLDPARNETAGEFYRRRLARLGVPVAAWTAFFLWFSVEVTGWVPTWSDAVANLLYGEPYAHLHFLFRILGLYAFTPMLRVFLRHADRRLVVLATALALGFAGANSVVDGIVGVKSTAFMRFAPFLGYYLLGYVLRDVRLDASGRACAWAAFLASVAVVAGGTGWMVGHFGQLIGYPSLPMIFYDFCNPVRVVMAIAAWSLLVDAFRDDSGKRWWSQAIAVLAPATLGIYLIHPLFRELLQVKLNLFALGPWQASGRAWPELPVLIGIPLVAALVYIPSAVVVMLLLKIPVLRRLTG